jgi:hypothetical protein
VRGERRGARDILDGETQDNVGRASRQRGG